MPTIVVVGAGVSGLTCALQLAKQKGNVVTVVAKHMPGDYDIEYTSPWAGANVLPMALEKDSRWEKQTWPELSRLAKEVPEAGIHYQTVRVLRRTADASTDFKGPFSDGLFALNPWFKTLMPDYHDLPAASLPPGIHSASEFTSVCINTAVYLPWLAGQCAAHGVVLRRAVLSHIAEAASLSHSGSRQADIIINASGLLACKLGGVMDSKVHARRGQTVLVRNEAGPVMMCMSGTKDGAEEMCYTMTRALGGGTILGGTYQLDNWDEKVDVAVAERIMRRAVEVRPELVGGDLVKGDMGKGVEGLSVVRHGVGLRPARDGGVRIEKERIEGGVWVVHNYGHAGWGYQGSYGCAERVVELVGEIVREGEGRAKL